MNDLDQEAEWSRSLAQAAGFARVGATSEAVARALSVHRAAAKALVEGKHTPSEQEVCQTYFDRAWVELGRFRALHALAAIEVSARTQAYRGRQLKELLREPEP